MHFLKLEIVALSSKKVQEEEGEVMPSVKKKLDILHASVLVLS